MLRSVGVGEDSLLLEFFTRELGVLWAKAQGARKLKSKNRYHLQKFSHGNFSFVLGKAGWRLISSESLSEKYQANIKELRENTETVAKLSALVSRLSPGENVNEGLFEDFEKGVFFLRKENLNEGTRKDLETLVAIKVLFHLGYWDRAQNDINIFDFESYNHETLQKLAPLRRKLNGEIHRAIEYSHL